MHKLPPSCCVALQGRTAISLMWWWWWWWRRNCVKVYISVTDLCEISLHRDMNKSWERERERGHFLEDQENEWKEEEKEDLWTVESGFKVTNSKVNFAIKFLIQSSYIYLKSKLWSFMTLVCIWSYFPRRGVAYLHLYYWFLLQFFNLE